MPDDFERCALIVPDRPDHLAVDFGVPHWGWIELTCPGLVAKDAVYCTHVDDPFDEFIAWLEAIAGGAQHAVWQVAEEGNSSHFIYLGARGFVGDNVRQLIVTHTGDGIHAATLCPVSPKRLVRDFYNAFRRMVESPDYERSHWEYMGIVEDEYAEDDEERAENAELRRRVPLLRDQRSRLVEDFIAGP